MQVQILHDPTIIAQSSSGTLLQVAKGMHIFSIAGMQL